MYIFPVFPVDQGLQFIWWLLVLCVCMCLFGTELFTRFPPTFFLFFFSPLFFSFLFFLLEHSNADFVLESGSDYLWAGCVQNFHCWLVQELVQ